MEEKSQVTPADEQTERSRQIVSDWYTALQQGDMEGVVGAMDENIIVNVLGSSGVSGRHEGRDAFVANGIGPIFAALEPESVEFAKRWRIFAAEGERVVVLMEGFAAAKNGCRYDNKYCHLFTIRDGRIAELWEFLDTVVVEEAIFDNPLQSSREAPAAPFSF
jgi:ketosteroid isomerase-like protein